MSETGKKLRLTSLFQGYIFFFLISGLIYVLSITVQKGPLRVGIGYGDT